MNLNKVFLLGRLTADPQLRTTTNGHQVATFSVATNRIWNDKISGKKEDTEFHNIVVWERQAEIASRFLAKGSLVLVEGRLQTRSWDDKQGQQRKTTEIVAERIQLGPRPYGAAKTENPVAAPGHSSGFQPAPEVPTINVDESAEEEQKEIKPEDLPF